MLSADHSPPARSKSQQKKLAKFEPRPPIPKPVLPDGVSIPEDEEIGLRYGISETTSSSAEWHVLSGRRRMGGRRYEQSSSRASKTSVPHEMKSAVCTGS